MVRKIKNTGHNIPEIVLSLVPPLEEQGQNRENSSPQNSKNNKSHKKRKNREQKQTKKYIIPDIIITDLSDDVQDKGLTNSNSNNSNKKFPKNIINIEDKITSTNHDFDDFDYTFNESINNIIKQQKKEDPITNKNLLLNNNNNNSSSKNIKANQLWKFLKKKFLIKGYDLQTIS